MQASRPEARGARRGAAADMCKMSFKVSAAPAGGRAGRAADLQRWAGSLRPPGAAAGPQDGVGAAPEVGWVGTGVGAAGQGCPSALQGSGGAGLCVVLALRHYRPQVQWPGGGRRAAGTVAGVTGGRGGEGALGLRSSRGPGLWHRFLRLCSPERQPPHCCFLPEYFFDAGAEGPAQSELQLITKEFIGSFI